MRILLYALIVFFVTNIGGMESMQMEKKEKKMHSNTGQQNIEITAITLTASSSSMGREMSASKTKIYKKGGGFFVSTENSEGGAVNKALQKPEKPVSEKQIESMVKVLCENGFWSLEKSLTTSFEEPTRSDGQSVSTLRVESNHPEKPDYSVEFREHSGGTIKGGAEAFVKITSGIYSSLQGTNSE